MDIYYYILSPFSWLLNLLYSFVESYGFAIILFAVVVKLFLFPFSLKGKRGMIQMNMLSAQMQKLQKQYGTNRQKYNEEVQNLYAKEGVNPMSGCLWSLLPMFVLIPLYAIIRQPLKYMMGLDEGQIIQIASALDWENIAVTMNWTTPEMIATAIEKSTALVAENAASIVSGFQNSGYNQLYLASMINETNFAAVTAAVGEGTNVFAINFDFFGMNLAMVPNWRIWDNFTMANLGLVLLVVISACSSMLMSVIMMKTNKMNNTTQNEAAERTSKTMMYISPIMSLWIGFVMPAGLCVYWIANNLLTMIQELIAGRILKKDYAAARLASEERARLEKEDEKANKIKLAEDRSKRIESEKNSKGKKKKVSIAKKEETEEDGINKTDSCVGMRSHARGRSYDPHRYGTDATPYRDPTTLAADETVLSLEDKTKEDDAE